MLKNPDFRLLASGTIFNSVGFQGEQVDASLLLYQLPGSTVWVGVGLALSFLPMLLIGVPAGATADHFDRRRLLPLIEAGMFIAMAGAAWLFRSAEPGMTALLTLLLVTGSLRALHQDIVGRRTKCNTGARDHPKPKAGGLGQHQDGKPEPDHRRQIGDAVVAE